MVEELKVRFDYVIMDAPPLGAFADATILASIADATLLVVREGFTRRPDLAAGVEQLEKANVPVAGLVLNCGALGTASFGYGLGYGRCPSGSGETSIARLAFGGAPKAAKHSAKR